MFDSLRQLTISLLAHLRTRLTLLKLEFEREKVRLSVMLISVGLALLFCLLTVVMSAFGVIAYFWDTDYRLQAVWSLAALFLVGTIVCTFVFRAKLKTRSALFEGSLAELHKDQEALEHSMLEQR